MLKIVMINHTFQKERFYKRWKMLAEKHTDWDVTLLAPTKFKWYGDYNNTFGVDMTQTGKELDEGNFHIRLIDLQKHKFIGWTSKQLSTVLKEISPDVIYYIGVHTHEALQQIIDIRNRHLPNTKLLAFSMRGTYHSLDRIKSRINAKKLNPIKKLLRYALYLYIKLKIKRVNKYCDAIFCHHPEGRDEFVKEGYKKPIYLQTQVGVDPDYFHFDNESRKKMREKYNIGDAYCFGSATRFSPSKGLFDVIAALPNEGNWKYLMMGSGLPDEENEIKKAIQERGLEDKIILTGYIELEDMAEHWNALDCAVHIPRTVEDWEETFSLSLVQAMATGLPVIGNTSGSVPYQIGEDGIVLEEGNIEQLKKQFVYMIENQEYGEEIGKKMLKRAVSCFGISHLDDCFYDTVTDIMNGVYDENKADMAKYLVE